jgi:LacI family transcriptional regulator
MSVTLKDIARATGFSVTTVSRALGDYDDVAAETKSRIKQVAQELGYYPSATARQLQKRRTDTIGFVIPTFGPRFSDPYFSELLASIGNEAAEHDFDLLVSTRPPDGEEEREAYRRLVNGRRVDGLLVVRTRLKDWRIAYLAERGVPFVAFGRSELPFDFPWLDVDGALGMEQVTQHLVDQGHRRIAYISAPEDLMFSFHRMDGYKRALKKNGLSFVKEWVVFGDLTERGGRQAAQKLLDLSPPPTAIIVCNDLMALGAFKAAHEQNLAIGQDIAITGFDDIPLAENAHPPLTSVRQPIYFIGTTICRMLIQLIRGEALEERQVLLKPQLIVRESG